MQNEYLVSKLVAGKLIRARLIKWLMANGAKKTGWLGFGSLAFRADKVMNLTLANLLSLKKIVAQLKLEATSDKSH